MPPIKKVVFARGFWKKLQSFRTAFWESTGFFDLKKSCGQLFCFKCLNGSVVCKGLRMLPLQQCVSTKHWTFCTHCKQHSVTLCNHCNQCTHYTFCTHCTHYKPSTHCTSCTHCTPWPQLPTCNSTEICKDVTVKPGQYIVNPKCLCSGREIEWTGTLLFTSHCTFQTA